MSYPPVAEPMSVSACGLLVGGVYVRCVRCRHLTSGGEDSARREAVMRKRRDEASASGESEVVRTRATKKCK
jgi:hypothetical protein